MKMRKLAPKVPVFSNSDDFGSSEKRPEGAQESMHQGHETKSQAAIVRGKSRRTCMLSIDLIDANPFSSREIYTPRMIRDRATALLIQGQRDPIHVIPNPNKPDRFIIADGWIRVQACRDYRVMNKLLAEVHEGMSMNEAAWFGYEQNEVASQYCELDRAMFYEKLTQRGATETQIKKYAYLSSSQMIYYRSFAQLPADVMEVVRRDPRRFDAIAVHQISKVVRCVGVKQAVKLAARYCEKERRFSWLVGQVQALIEAKEDKRNGPSKKVKFRNGFYEVRGSSVKVRITIENPAVRASFLEKLEELLATYESPRVS